MAQRQLPANPFVFPVGMVTLMVALAFGGCARDAEPPRWNLILISFDTLRADHLSTYGYRRQTSPNIDRLAMDGLLFEQAFSQSPKTATSHMTIMTGMYPPAHGVKNLDQPRVKSLPEGIPTLAEILHQAGYRNEAYTGSANVKADLGFGRGFSVYEQLKGAEEIFAQSTRALQRLAQPSEPEVTVPFFLFVHTFAVHDPYTPGDEYARRFVDPDYRGEIIHSADELIRLARDGGYWPRADVFWSQVDQESEADHQHLRDLYDAEILYADDLLGRFLATLDDLELDESTVVVFLSDHGEQFFEHGGYVHNNLYQHTLHVPLIFRFPEALGFVPGTRVEGLVQLVDVLPTVLELLELPSLEHLQGRSLLPVLHGAEPIPRPVFSQWIRVGKFWALRDGDWKYLREMRSHRLYDLSHDPGEQTDLAASEPEIYWRMRQQTDEFVRQSWDVSYALQHGPPVEVDEETRQQLEAMGYLDPP